MKALRLLHGADLHLDSPFESLPPEKAAQRRERARELPFKLVELSQELGAQAILLSGDVFDSSRVSTETQRDFCRALGAASCPVIIAPGNHDPYYPGGVWDTMSLPENVYVFKNESIQSLRLPGLQAKFWGAAFQDSFSQSLLDGFQAPEKTEDFDIMLLHGELCSGQSDYNPITAAQLESCGMDYVALGHIHKRSPLAFAGKTAYANPGCTEGRGYDELGEMGVYLVDLDENTVRAQFVPVGGVRYEIRTADISGDSPVDAVLKSIEGLPQGSYLRLILRGECESLPDITRIRAALEGRLAELQLRDETTQKRELWETAGQDSLKGLFLQGLKEKLKNAQSPREAKVIEMAAAFGLEAMENGGAAL